MFRDIVDPTVKVGSQQWYTVPVSILVHTTVVLALIVIPLMAADVLPTPPSMLAFAAAPPPPPPPPPPAAPKPIVEVNPAAAPIEAPKEIAPEPPDTSFERAEPVGIAGGV